MKPATLAALQALAITAHALADNDDTWGTEAQEDADTEFWTLAHANMTAEQIAQLDELCVKATAAECIEHGCAILGLVVPKVRS